MLELSEYLLLSFRMRLHYFFSHDYQRYSPPRWTVRAGTMMKILENYPYLMQLWPQLRAETKEQAALSRIIGIEARMKEYSFLFGKYTIYTIQCKLI